MKKIYIIFIALVITSAGYFLIEDNVDSDGFTPEQLARLEYQKKKEKRHNGYHKSDKPDQYARYNEAIRTKDGDSKPQYKSNYKTVEYLKAKQSSKFNSNASRMGLSWIERGPGNVPGRTRGLIVMPDDPNLNTWLAGSVGGGIWKTTDAGQSWINKTSHFPNLATTSIVMSASNNDIIYAGTGEQYANYNAINGDGLFKSIDAGETWTQLNSTANNNDFRNINRLVVDPTDPNILVVATSNSWWGTTGSQSKIMRSTDGGASWTKVAEASNDIDHIVAAPSDFNIQYASINSGSILKSIDAGVTWVNKSNGISSNGRMEIAVGNNDVNLVYVSAQGSQSSAGSDLFITKDGAENWALVTNVSGTNPDFLGGQGFYDNTIAVHPYDDDIVYVAGVDIFKFTIDGDLIDSEPKVLSAEEDSTDAFMTYVVFSESNFSNGSVAILTDEGTDITPEEFVSIEIRFGPGKSQKAHRFTVPDGSTSGVPIADYSYADYTDVPFEVWDITNNKQLMVSYRDQENNGVFNLNDGTEDERAVSREYLFINEVDYDAITPSSDIAQSGGRAFRQMYFFWPLQVIGTTWDESTLPDSKLVVNHGVGLEGKRNVVSVADAYGRHDGPNPFSQGSDHSNVTGPHPDHHGLYMVKVDEGAKTFKIINTSDGGVYFSNTSDLPGEAQGDWSFAGNGYNTTQFYGIDKKRGANEYIGGTQDNGTWKSTPDENASATTKYSRQLGGDGFEVVWNYNDPQKIIGTIYYNDIIRTTDGGANWSSSTNGLDNTSDNDAPFITKLANVKFDPDVVYAVGASGIWKSTDFAENWTGTDITDDLWNYTGYADVDISLANADIVWAGSGMSTSRSLFVSRDKGVTFNATSNYAKSLGFVSGMASHPVDENTFFALFSFSDNPKILKTTDLGDTWVDISGFGETDEESSTGFPDVAVYSMIVRPDNPDIYWVGTEIGLIESTDAGATWHLADNGVPNVSIWDMKVVDDQIVLGTHGRGIWTVTLSELLYTQSSVSETRYIGKQTMEVDVDLSSNFESLEIYVDGVLANTITDELTTGVHTYEVAKTTEEVSKVNIIAYIDDTGYTSPKINSVGADFAPVINNLLAGNPRELLFDIQSIENYSSIELYLDDVKVGEITSPVIGKNEMVVTGLESKIYSGHVVGILDGDSYESSSFSAEVITGIFNFWNEKSVSIYPNPVSNIINIEIEKGKQLANVRIHNITGKFVLDIKTNESSVDVSELESGIYFLNFTIDEKEFTERIVIQH